jgi:hypothetical protein
MPRKKQTTEPGVNGQEVETANAKTLEVKEPAKEETRGRPKKPVEKYFKVRFHDKSNPEDQDNVELSVNGEVLVLQREKEVVLPERFLICAQNATYPVYKQLPGKQRKIQAWVKTFPFSNLGEADEKEFIRQKTEGNKKTKENIQRYGYDAEVEE